MSTTEEDTCQHPRPQPQPQPPSRTPRPPSAHADAGAPPSRSARALGRAGQWAAAGGLAAAALAAASSALAAGSVVLATLATMGSGEAAVLDAWPVYLCHALVGLLGLHVATVGRSHKIALPYIALYVLALAQSAACLWISITLRDAAQRACAHGTDAGLCRRHPQLRQAVKRLVLPFVAEMAMMRPLVSLTVRSLPRKLCAPPQQPPRAPRRAAPPPR
eukprot:m51a1_g1071 hypothetical protein (219) ;mRNA; f:854517-855232